MSYLTPKSSLGVCLVIGGCGFLGHHIVRQLLDDPTCTSVAVMSRSPFKNRFDGVTYFIGNIKNPEHVNLVVSQVKPTVIFNTASPHAYIDHEQAPDYFLVNVDGNKILLAAAAAVGTVKAYVYTSSGPIIAGSGAGYDHADESHPTLAVIRKGDPYHLAKALGDQLVLDANRQIGIRTACVRPTALYGEGDEQMIIPTLNVLKDGQTHLWMGNNDIEMDVVYVGHVARVQLLAAHGLLTGIEDPTAPKVDGEAFNVTDDQPSPPWSFFRLYWIDAGDKTPLSSIWMFPPWLVMFLANSAEFITWSTSWGRLRPKLLKRERMEFVLKTRTYSIKKARERLGFVPWHNQNWTSQEEAVKGSVRLYLNETNGGRLLTSKASDWPEHPFKLISDTGAKANSKIPLDHFCLTNAKLMALTHNTIFRALNAIYAQALQIKAGSQDAADLLSYCTVVYDFIHHHHVLEETMYFPEIDKAAGLPGLMDSNLEEHRKLDEGLEKFRKYAESTRKDQYSGETLQSILKSFAVDFENHMNTEIKIIVDLHDRIDSKSLERIYSAMFDASEHQSDIFKSAPLVLGCQDAHFHIDDEPAQFPKLSSPFACFFVSNILARRHANLWRFNPSNMYGTPRKLPAPPITSTTESRNLMMPYNQVSSPLEARNMQLFVLIVLFFSVLAACFGIGMGEVGTGMVGNSGGGEKAANFSTWGGIV